MAKKVEHEEHGESAPLWIISFADLVTLLMSFFVILAVKPAGSIATTDFEFAEVAAAIRAAFHNLPPAEAAATRGTDYNDLTRRLLALLDKEGTLNRGDTNEKGMRGKSFRVRRLRDGMEITLGGPVMFEPFSVKPTPEGEQQLQQVMDIIKGHRNIIEIRGHAADEPAPADWTYDDTMKLSFSRAEYVADRLIALGTDRRMLRLMAVGPNEPIAREASDRAENRRVEIIVRESLIDDYLGQPAATQSSSAAAH